MASGVPVITTRVGGTRQTVTGSEAILVDQDNLLQFRVPFVPFVRFAQRLPFSQHGRDELECALILSFRAEQRLGQYAEVYSMAGQRRSFCGREQNSAHLKVWVAGSRSRCVAFVASRSLRRPAARTIAPVTTHLA
jgi:hypothetical protein